MAYETNAKNSQDLGRPTSCVHDINNRSDKIGYFGQIKQLRTKWTIWTKLHYIKTEKSPSILFGFRTHRSEGGIVSLSRPFFANFRNFH